MCETVISAWGVVPFCAPVLGVVPVGTFGIWSWGRPLGFHHWGHRVWWR